jgi:probable rRNA maturation factor
MPTSADDSSAAGAAAAGDDLVVEVCDAQCLLKVDVQILAGLARRVLRAEGVERAEISLTLVDNATIRQLNRRHLEHDWPTDVISFLLTDPAEPELAGEVIVSAEMALTTAAEIGADPWAELALYVVHGLLHLCGYDDTTDAAAISMRAREARALRLEGLTNTFRLARPAPYDGMEREQAACSG